MADDNDKRREHPRVDAAFRVAYPDMDQLVVAYTQNLSRGGLFVDTDRPLPKNAVIRVNLTLPDDGGEVPIIARVVHVRDAAEAAREGGPVGIGLEFLDVARGGLDAIEAYIESRTAAEAEHSGPIRVAGRLRVVVVDDDGAIRDTAAAPFRARGDEVVTAKDGLIALGKCLEHPPDVVLSDVAMPRMDGWTLLRVLRSRPSTSAVPVLFLTSLDGETERLRGYRLGVDDYIAKPFAADELVARALCAVARAREARPSPAERRTLRGELAQVSLGSLLSFLELERKTGVVLVVGAATGRLFIRDGKPVAVEIDPAGPSGAPAERVMELLSWSEGQFEFADQDVARADEIGASVQTLLLEHARLGDEANR